MKLGHRISLIVALAGCYGSLPTSLAAEEDYNQQIRCVQDAGRLVSRLAQQASGKSALIPAFISSKGLNNDPAGPAGFYASGTVKLLNWNDEGKAIKVVPYRIPISAAPRSSQEEGKHFSPYLSNGGFALIESNDEINKGALTHFPLTYAISDAWYADLDRLISASQAPSENGKAAESPLSICMALSSVSSEGDPNEILKFIAKGDAYSRGLAIVRLFRLEPARRKEAFKDLLAYLNNDPSPDVAYGITLGVVTAMSENEIPKEEIKPLLQALTDFCQKKGSTADASYKLLQWIESAY